MTTTVRPHQPLRVREGGEYARPRLYPHQVRALFHDRRYGVIEATTKSGKTTGALAWLIEQAVEQGLYRNQHCNYWWVAPIFSQARIAFRRAKAMLPRPNYLANESEMTITLRNGAVLWFKSGDNADALFGEDVYAAVIDEASRVKDESFYAVRSTLTSTNGLLRLIGNVKGRKNWFYRLARRAEDGEADMAFARITAADAVQAGILSAEEVADARRLLPEAVFRELYMAEASDDEGNPFGLTAIRACIAPARSRAAADAFGVDLAKSTDWTVILGLDADGSECAFQRFQRPWLETEHSILALVGKVRALVDSTGVGDPVVEGLQRRGGRNFEGFKFTAGSKQQLMEGLAVAVQQGKVRFVAGPVVTELESFEYEYTRTGVRYSAPSGMHDDCVIALGLAWAKHAEERTSVRFIDWRKA